jgi:hypothetical protein
MSSNPKHYVTLHASVLRKAILDIVESSHQYGWTAEHVEAAIRGIYVAAHDNGGTINSIEELTNLVVRRSGTPPNAVRH